MQGTVGHWVAIGILALAAAYGIGSYFNQQANYERMESQLKNAKAADLAQMQNQDVGNLMQENEKLKETLNVKDTEIADHKTRIRNLESELRTEKTLASEADKKREEAALNALSSQKDAADLREKIEVVRNTQDEDLKKNIERLERQILESKALIEEKTREQENLKTNNTTLTEAALRRIRTLQRDKAQLLETLNKKAEAIRRRASSRSNEADGKLLSLDIPSKFCVVNLGKINNVHRGMRFDVIRWRLNKWDKMGAIEITKVGTSTSDAIIIDKSGTLKICPLTGYRAKNPEERYSPYAAQGEGSQQVVPLVRMSEDDSSTMDETDPIIVGDSISNPFYDRDKKIKFAITGEPVVYSQDILKNHIKEAGGIIQDNIGIDTDFLILGKIPEKELINEDNKEEMKRFEEFTKTMNIASQYGIPIMREVELYDFLRN